jgi:integral membrane protein (TIGR01906 family)
MKVLSNIAQLIFIICLPALALTASIAFAVNNSHFYTYRFEKYDVQQSLAEAGLNLTDSQMQDIATEFIRYFNSGEELVHLTVMQDGKSVELFNREEILHFKDVKGLFRLDYYVLLGTFVYCMVYALWCIFRWQGRYRLKLARNAVTGSVLTLGLMAVLGIGMLLDFDSIFYQFHLISFSNDYWSAAGNMLLLFPEGFWVDAVIYCALVMAGIVVVLGGAGGGYLIVTRKNSKFEIRKS